ncbi:MAG: DUF2520 domain-containing protein [Flavobacteriales bacterium AspAUS03]
MPITISLKKRYLPFGSIWIGKKDGNPRCSPCSFLSNQIPIKEEHQSFLNLQSYPKNTIQLTQSQYVSFTIEISKIEKVNLYIIFTSDEAIEEVSYLIPFEDTLVIHTSGSTLMSSLKEKYRKGVFYTLQTFIREKNIDYSQILFLIEVKEEKDLVLLKNITKKISGIYHTGNSDQRAQAYLSAVWICNFIKYFYHISQQIHQQERLPFQVLKPLILETAEKINLLNSY